MFNSYHGAKVNNELFFRSPGVNFSSSIEKNLDDVYVTPRSCKAERSVVGNIAMFLIGSPEQQQLNHLTRTGESYTALLMPEKRTGTGMSTL